MFLSLLLAQATPHAERGPACPALPPTLPVTLSGWSAMTPVLAGTDADSAATLPVGRGARATLLRAPAVTLPARATHPALPDSNSGMFAFTAVVPGRYQIALGASAWVDVVANGRALPSVAHEHGPACSPVRKIVQFDLVSGRYLLQVVGAKRPRLALMVARGG